MLFDILAILGSIITLNPPGSGRYLQTERRKKEPSPSVFFHSDEVHHLICHLNSFEVDLSHHFPEVLQLMLYPPVIQRGLLENHTLNNSLQLIFHDFPSFTMIFPALNLHLVRGFPWAHGLPPWRFQWEPRIRPDFRRGCPSSWDFCQTTAQASKELTKWQRGVIDE